MSPRLAAFEMAGFAETNPPISLRLPRGKGMADDKLLVKHVSGVKTICGGIEYGVFRVSPAAGSALKQVRANSVDLQFVTDTSGLRSVCGIVASAIGGLGDSGLAPYQLIDRDALSLRDKTINMRVFRNAREIEITNTILCD